MATFEQNEVAINNKSAKMTKSDINILKVTCEQLAKTKYAMFFLPVKNCKNSKNGKFSRKNTLSDCEFALKTQKQRKAAYLKSLTKTYFNKNKNLEFSVKTKKSEVCSPAKHFKKSMRDFVVGIN